MPFIKFLTDRSTVEAEPQHFKAGQVYELPEASCERWVRRGAAEHVAGEQPSSAAPGEEPARPAAKTPRRKA